jgi:hypothetical protein
MNRRQYLASLGLASAGAVAGCSGDSSENGTGDGNESENGNESETGASGENPTATLQTTAGDIEMRLFEERAPTTG